MHGAGGQGKTRLAARLADGEEAGWLVVHAVHTVTRVARPAGPDASGGRAPIRSPGHDGRRRIRMTAEDAEDDEDDEDGILELNAEHFERLRDLVAETAGRPGPDHVDVLRLRAHVGRPADAVDTRTTPTSMTHAAAWPAPAGRPGTVRRPQRSSSGCSPTSCASTAPTIQQSPTCARRPNRPGPKPTQSSDRPLTYAPKSPSEPRFCSSEGLSKSGA
ncbi:MAG: hypothetical protein JF597_05530 [Streptomyces sp.]|nr:hypothetical protein [Streptomyces sp.]